MNDLTAEPMLETLSFRELTFTKYLLSARYSSRHWGLRSAQGRQIPPHHGARTPGGVDRYQSINKQEAVQSSPNVLRPFPQNPAVWLLDAFKAELHISMVTIQNPDLRR